MYKFLERPFAVRKRYCRRCLALIRRIVCLFPLILLADSAHTSDELLQVSLSSGLRPPLLRTPAVSKYIQTKVKTRQVETTDVPFESHFRFVFPACLKSKQPSKKMGEMIQETTS